MDTDLFQLVAVALLFLCFLALLAALSILSGIKNQLASRSINDASPPAQSTYEYQAPTTSYEPASTYSEPAPQVQAQEVSTGFVPMAEAASASGAPLASEPAGSSSIPGGLRGDEPEEQPFERDGRWWFKRGGELLVYDEGTGQWVASGAAGAAPASSGAAATSMGAQTSVGTRADTGEGWKCSSCGAVNGSTATSCRMCFAPR